MTTAAQRAVQELHILATAVSSTQRGLQQLSTLKARQDL